MADLTDNVARSRYEMVVDGQTSYVSYMWTGDRLTLVHTEVPKALGGRGVGSALATAVFSAIRRRGLRVAVKCEFLQAFVKRHPEFADLVVMSDEPA
ncbi:MAG: N-acetyltransferase [Rhodospirillales bacterium 69-11]|nr:N-acetyltransferase [Rhodospirillales bacterium]MBN8907412.1 N-acetyltransferase [Rhodospirillales bacterium]MBN8928876.1 N-acetyltransferase [Rhodospirillales bacterium]OJW29613.1 MAG: N-acetyltransferase [Rhodospirillales bacterium 69-11]